MLEQKVKELENKLGVAERRINRLIELQTRTAIIAINYRSKFYESTKRTDARSKCHRISERKSQAI